MYQFNKYYASLDCSMVNYVDENNKKTSRNKKRNKIKRVTKLLHNL